MSCSSPTFCMAVDSYEGNSLRFDGTGWSAPDVVQPGLNGLIAVSCAGGSLCVAIDYSSDAFVWRGDGVDGRSRHRPVPGQPAVDIVPDQVLLRGRRRRRHGVPVRRQHMVGAQHISIHRVRPARGLVSLQDVLHGRRCVRECLPLQRERLGCSGIHRHRRQRAAGLVLPVGILLHGRRCDRQRHRFDGTSWATPILVDGRSRRVFRVSCPSSSFCVAIGYQGDAVTFDGAGWSAATNISPDSGLAAVSCASSTFCVAVGNYAGTVTMFDGVSWTDPRPDRPRRVEFLVRLLRHGGILCGRRLGRERPAIRRNQLGGAGRRRRRRYRTDRRVLRGTGVLHGADLGGRRLPRVRLPVAAAGRAAGRRLDRNIQAGKGPRNCRGRSPGRALRWGACMT